MNELEKALKEMQKERENREKYIPTKEDRDIQSKLAILEQIIRDGYELAEEIRLNSVEEDLSRALIQIRDELDRTLERAEWCSNAWFISKRLHVEEERIHVIGER